MTGPVKLPNHLVRWTGRSGWTITINRFGDLYCDDHRVGHDEVPEFESALAAMVDEARVNALTCPELHQVGSASVRCLREKGHPVTGRTTDRPDEMHSAIGVSWR